MRAIELRKLDGELKRFLAGLLRGMGRVERREALTAYVTGLLLDGERKSIEPMAARLVDDASEIESMRQRLQQAVVVADWPDEEMRRRLALKLNADLPDLEAFVVDDTGFRKKGVHSVGVSRQWSGTLGHVDNCQVAVSLHLAGENASGCIAMRLFLPESWTERPDRRARVGVPPELEFQKKWEIALTEIDDAIRWGIRHDMVLADAGYGDASEFRRELRKRGLNYAVQVQGKYRVWPPGVVPRPPLNPPGQVGRPRTYWVGKEEPRKIANVALEIPRSAYRTVNWRGRRDKTRSSRFAAVWVHPAENHQGLGGAREPAEAQWLLCQWLEGDTAPAKFWLITLRKDTALKELVRIVKLRWRVERDYQELKQELGLDHYEGRTWRGFHHHATLCAMAHGFLALRRSLFPPVPWVDAA